MIIFFLVVLICFSTCLLELLSVATLGRLRGGSYSHWSSFRPANVMELTILVWVCLFGIFSFSGCKFRISFMKLYSKRLLGTFSVPTRFMLLVARRSSCWCVSWTSSCRRSDFHFRLWMLPLRTTPPFFLYLTVIIWYVGRRDSLASTGRTVL